LSPAAFHPPLKQNYQMRLKASLCGRGGFAENARQIFVKLETSAFV
jgi:hypothetical protein